MTENVWTFSTGVPVDQGWRRLSWLIPSALVLWGAVLVIFAHLLNLEPLSPPPAPIEVGLLMVGGLGGGAGSGPAASGVGAAGAGSSMPASGASASKPISTVAATSAPEPVKQPPETKVSNPAPTPALKVSSPAPTPAPKATPVHNEELAKPKLKALTKPAPKALTKPAPKAIARRRIVKPPPPTSPAPAHAVAKASPPSPVKPPNGSSLPSSSGAAAAPAGNSGGGTQQALGRGPGGAGGGGGGLFGSSSGGAQAIYAPLPKIPDDLRAEVFHAEAVARFQIMPDGTAQVVLVRPTPNPRLNYLLLETLKQWRFFPAIKDGRAVSSVVEIRIPIAVE